MKSSTFPVVLYLEDGSYKVLGKYKSYEDADRAIDKFCDKYPNGFIDILDSFT